MAKKKPYRFFLYWVARGFGGILYVLPRRFALWLAEKLGYLAFAVVSRQRNAILRHLHSAYGDSLNEKEIRAIARKVLGEQLQTGVELLQFPKLTPKKIEQIVDYGDTMETYRGLLKEGKGIISITAHLGNWEFLAGAVISKIPGVVVGRRLYYEPYNQWLLKLRQSLNVRTIYRDQSPRHILRALRQNFVVGILPDQDIDSLNGVFVPFFGKLAYTPVSPVKLSLVSGAPMVMSFLVRIPKGKYRLVVTGVLRPCVETTEEAAILKYTAQWMESFEQMVRRYPEQWAWMHNRWKTRPENEPVTVEKTEQE